MNEHEAARIAAAVHRLRPDWPVQSLLTLMMKRLGDRPRRDVAVALTWVACDSQTQTPARVLEQGPWWRAAAVEAEHRPANHFDPATACGICALPREKCESHARPDHEFVPHALHMRMVRTGSYRAEDDMRGPRREVCNEHNYWADECPTCNPMTTTQHTPTTGGATVSSEGESGDE